jgi:hypothetical protein
MSRSALLTSLFSLCILAYGAAGCAVSADGSEDAAEAHAQLSNADESLVGRYYARSVPAGGIARLTLSASGAYTAQVDATGRAECIAAPCLLPESGTWSTRETGRGVSLELREAGASARSYDVTTADGRIEITIAGHKQELTELGANQCITDGDCDEGSACARRVCRMACLTGDPFCCAVSTCAPKPAAQP